MAATETASDRRVHACVFGLDGPKSHQRSWWIVHTQPTKNQRTPVPNPTNAVGGLFILSLQKTSARLSLIPPTQLVDCSYSAYDAAALPAVSLIPSTELVNS